MKPLTKQEKIYAIGLGLGLIYQSRQKGDEEKLVSGLQHLAALVDDESKDELRELCNRGLVDSLKTQKPNSWPTLGKNKPEEEDDDGADSKVPLHEMDHRDALVCGAIALARLAKAGAPISMYKSGLRILKKLVTDADIEWARQTMEAGMKKCGCKSCLKGLELKDKVEQINDLDQAMDAVIDILDKNKKKPDTILPTNDDDGYDPEDPYRTLSA